MAYHGTGMKRYLVSKMQGIEQCWECYEEREMMCGVKERHGLRPDYERAAEITSDWPEGIWQ